MALAEQAQETIFEILKLGFAASATMDELAKERERAERWYQQGDITDSFLNKKIAEFAERKNDALQALEADASKLIDTFNGLVESVYQIDLEKAETAYQLLSSIDPTPDELETLYLKACETENYTELRQIQATASRNGLRITCGFADYGETLKALVNRAKEYSRSIALDESGTYRSNLDAFAEMFEDRIADAEQKSRSFMVG